jgi:hypothetical protein
MTRQKHTPGSYQHPFLLAILNDHKTVLDLFGFRSWKIRERRDQRFFFNLNKNKPGKKRGMSLFVIVGRDFKSKKKKDRSNEK